MRVGLDPTFACACEQLDPTVALFGVSTAGSAPTCRPQPSSFACVRTQRYAILCVAQQIAVNRYGSAARPCVSRVECAGESVRLGNGE
jgi:hypothetical protein